MWCDVCVSAVWCIYLVSVWVYGVHVSMVCVWRALCHVCEGGVYVWCVCGVYDV